MISANSVNTDVSTCTSTLPAVPLSYTPTPTRLLKIQQLNKGQQTRFILNIGGTKFETSAETISSFPDSVLSAMIAEDSPMKPYQIDGRSSYFIDRDPRHFPLILNYLRNKARLHTDLLPRDIKQLRELQIECNFYELTHLERYVQKKILDLQRISLF